MGRFHPDANAPPERIAELVTRESQVRAPTEMIAIGDANLVPWRGLFAAGYLELGYQLGMFPPGLALREKCVNETERRHRKRQQIVFCDGHVEAIRYTELSANDPNIRRRWCYDNDPHTDRGYYR